MSTPAQPVRSGTRVRIVLALVVAAVVAAVAFLPGLRSAERRGLIELSELGALAPVVLVGLYSLGALLLLPVFWLDLAAGAHFGFLWGVFWVHTAATLACTVSFFVGRHVVRGWVEPYLQRNPKIVALSQAVEEDGWRLIFLTRLSPVFSFSLLNLVYGVTRVRFRNYFFASVVGMFPGTVLYVYAGDMAGDLSGAPGHADKPPFQWAVELGGFVATILVVVYVTHRAQRTLSARLGGDAGRT